MLSVSAFSKSDHKLGLDKKYSNQSQKNRKNDLTVDFFKDT